MSYEEIYLDGMKQILDKGKWVYNERTKTRCLTLPRFVYELELDEKSSPLLTTRPSYPVSAIAEIIGYLRRYEWSSQFKTIGSPTWDTNANKTQAWLGNPNRLGTDHLGKVYGAGLRKKDIDEVLNNIQNNVDNRGLILNWWQPHTFDYGCLRPCLSQHNFTLLNGSTYLTSTQRSGDAACGWNFNSIQVYFLGMLANKLSGNSGGSVLHVINNLHLYEQHIDGIEELLLRKPAKIDTKFNIKSWVEHYQDVTEATNHARDYFDIKGYNKDFIQDKIEFELVA